MAALKLEWMGRYRELVRSLIYYSNASNRGGHKLNPIDGIALTKHEYQILEYLCEFSLENKIMTDISHDLGILPSIVTKATKNLLSYGLIERYRIVGNKKSIVLKPTRAGENLYIAYYTRDIQHLFDPFFKALENTSDEQLAEFKHAIDMLSQDWQQFSDKIIAGDSIEKIDE